MRLKVKGWPKAVKVGYRRAKSARGLHPSGYREVLIHNPDDIAGIDPETQAIRIAHTVGVRKRILISTMAREREIHVLNPLVRKLEEEQIEEETLLEELPEDLSDDIDDSEIDAKEVPKEPKNAKKKGDR
jgi:large subunit ribosomal protein L32e